jgi:hypothetical protein
MMQPKMMEAWHPHHCSLSKQMDKQMSLWLLRNRDKTMLTVLPDDAGLPVSNIAGVLAAQQSQLPGPSGCIDK